MKVEVLSSYGDIYEVKVKCDWFDRWLYDMDKEQVVEIREKYGRFYFKNGQILSRFHPIDDEIHRYKNKW